MNETALLRRLQDHDQAALEQITNQYQSYVCTILMHMLAGTGTYADAEELCTDTFFSLWHNADAVRPGKLKAYLAAAARNKAKSWLRSRRELPMDLDELEIGDDSLPLEEQAIQAELARRVRQAVDRLPGRDREILLRYYYYLQNTEQISAQLGIPAATVRSRLARARNQLKKALKKEDFT